MTYQNMAFDELFHIVFTDDGSVKACGREACIEMAVRLGRHGSSKTGFLVLPDAYLAARDMLGK